MERMDQSRGATRCAETNPSPISAADAAENNNNTNSSCGHHKSNIRVARLEQDVSRLSPSPIKHQGANEQSSNDDVDNSSAISNKQKRETNETDQIRELANGTKPNASSRQQHSQPRPPPKPLANYCSHNILKLNHNNNPNLNFKSQFKRLVACLLLPFLIASLLPTLKWVDEKQHQHQQPLAATSSASLLSGCPLTWTDYLLPIIRLPLDRIRLESSGLMLTGVWARELINSDLQEEEEQTHMMLVAPGGGAGAGGGGYLAPGQQQHLLHNSNQLHHLHRQPAQQHNAYTNEQSQQQAQPTDAPLEYAAGPDGGGGGGADQVPGAPGGGGETSAGEASQVMLAPGARGGGVAGSSAALQLRNELPAVRALNVKCEKNHMTVNIVFDRPFFGMVFSKGHYNDQKCVHLAPNSGQTSVNFDIHLGKCGMSSSEATAAASSSTSTGLQQQQHQQQQQQQQPNGLFIENTIIIQYDPLVQEIYDQARKLRCTWYDYYEKSVSFRPYNVDMLDAVTANFLGDNIQCWMQIQVGKGPWSSEVAGIVKIGQTMSMVLAIKDDENKFDMLVRNCVAHDGKHQPIQLVDEYGCVARPKIMGKFQKVRNFGPSATVVSYAHFQAFKFPDSMSVHFQCTIQVCRFECPEPVCGGGGGAGHSAGELGASSGGQNSAAGADYATSGTEMVASKEAPASNFFAPNHTAVAHPNANSVQLLKLDESQGRIQVKMDTSMMAGRGGGATPMSSSAAGPPPPPHLLHASATTTGASPISLTSRPLMGASFYKPTGGAGGARSQQLQLAPPVVAQQQQQQQQLQSITSQQQFSHPYNSIRRSSASPAFALRLGDLVSAPTAPQPQPLAAPYEAEYPLSLIAAPRGLQMGSPVAGGGGGLVEQQQQHRFRRQIVDQIAPPKRSNASSHEGQQLQQHQHLGQGDRATRLARHLAATNQSQSTSVQTQRTIQVVSPDDVAFSLMENSYDNDHDHDLDQDNEFGGRPRDQHQFDVINGDTGESSPAAAAASKNFKDNKFTLGKQSGASKKASSSAAAQRRHQDRLQLLTLDQAASVCFSTSRFLLGALITLVALLGGIAVVTFVILRQRSQLEQKYSTVYDPSIEQQQPQPQPQQHHQAHHQDYRHQAELLARRQSDELQQRNNYLARLYSQFAPATYWRAN